MNNLKKLLSISIACIAMLSLFAACKSENQDAAEPPITEAEDVAVEESPEDTTDIEVTTETDATEDSTSESTETTSDTATN